MNSISTVKDCYDALTLFNLKGQVLIDNETRSLVFTIVRPKFKWHNFIKKAFYKINFKKFASFVYDRVIITIAVFYNFIEE